jgi:hypothetical protein
MRLFFPGFAPGPRKLKDSPPATVEELSRRVVELEGRIRQLEEVPHADIEPAAVLDLPLRNIRRLEGRSPE